MTQSTIPFLAGPYRPPRARRGDVLTCLVRDHDCIVLRWSDTPMPWPIGRARDRRAVSFIVTDELARAVATESNKALCHALGVTAQTITKWRKALGVGRMTPGSTKLARDLFNDRMTPSMRSKAVRLANTPMANAKKAAAKIGVPRPTHVRAILDRTGKPVSAKTRAKLSAAQRRRFAKRPPFGRVWSKADDRAVRTMAPADAAAKTGRTLMAVYVRRARLGVNT